MFGEPNQCNVNTGYTLLHVILQRNMRRAHESLAREQPWHLPQKYLTQHPAGKKRSKKEIPESKTEAQLLQKDTLNSVHLVGK